MSSSNYNDNRDKISRIQDNIHDIDIKIRAIEVEVRNLEKSVDNVFTLIEKMKDDSVQQVATLQQTVIQLEHEGIKNASAHNKVDKIQAGINKFIWLVMTPLILSMITAFTYIPSIIGD